MNSARRLADQPINQLRRSPLAPYVDAFERSLGERDYASETTATYLGCLAHVGRWMDQCRLQAERLDEDKTKRHYGALGSPLNRSSLLRADSGPPSHPKLGRNRA